jgi:hypothetical protein
MNIQGRLRPALEVARECANAAMGGPNADANISECANADLLLSECQHFDNNYMKIYIELCNMSMAFRRI